MAAPMPATGSSASRARLVLVLELHLHAGWLSTSGSRQLFVSMEVLEDEDRSSGGRARSRATVRDSGLRPLAAGAGGLCEPGARRTAPTERR